MPDVIKYKILKLEHLKNNYRVKYLNLVAPRWCPIVEYVFPDYF